MAEESVKEEKSSNGFFSSLNYINEEQRKKLALLFTILGVILWLYVIATYRIWWVHPNNEFGLYQVIPIWFWVGVIFLMGGILLILDCSPRYIFILQFIALNLMVWGTPIFIEPNARVTDAWIHFSRTNIILQTGNIPSSSVVRYLEWPGSFVYNALNLQILGTNFMGYLKFYPLISSTIFIFGYYLLVRKIIDDKIILRFALLLEIPLNVWLQFHFSPQSFALMLFPLIMLGFLKNDIKWWIVTGVLSVALILSHPTTSIFLGSIICSIFVITLILYLPIKGKRKNVLFQGIITVIVLAGTIFMLIFTGLWDRIYHLISENIGNFPNSFSQILLERAYATSSFLRLFISIVFGFLSFLAIISLRKKRKFLGLSLGWILGVSIIFLLDLNLPGSHFHNRALFYLFLIFPIIISLWINQSISLKRFKKPIAILLVTLSLFNLLTIFYLENEAIVSDSNLETVDFINEYFPKKSLYGEQALIIKAFTPDRATKAISKRTTVYNNALLVFDDYALVSNIVGEDVGIVYAKYNNTPYTNLVYSNSKFEVYLHNISS